MLEELRKKLVEIQTRMSEIINAAKNDTNRSLNAEEEVEFDKLDTEFKETKDKIETELKKESRSQIVDEAKRYLDSPENKPNKPPVNQSSSGFRNFGEFLYFVRFNPYDPRLQEKRALNMSVGAEGGFLVPEQFSQELLKITPQEAIFRPRARVIPAGEPVDSAITFPALDQSGAKGVYSGVTVRWLAEGGVKPATEPKFKEVKLDPKEVAAHIVVTDKLLRNAPASEAIITQLLRDAIIASEDHAFLSGDGVGKPAGIIGHASSIEIHRAVANQIAYADIVSIYSRVKFGGRLVWIASPTLLPQLMNLVDTNGNLIWQPNAREGAPGTLIGLPCILNERNPVLGSKGDLVLADPSYYMIKDGFGIAISASEHVYFTNNETVIKAFWNVDGQPWLTSPLTLEDGVTTVSPFVVLDVPTA
jgi:HK97 family phage major capsid protein